jgi:RNA polymerase sigma-70 factor (ECF subfamily)
MIFSQAVLRRVAGVEAVTIAIAVCARIPVFRVRFLSRLFSIFMAEMHGNPSSIAGAPSEASSAASPLEVWLRDARDGSNSALGLALDAARKYLLIVASQALDDKLKVKIGASDLVQDTYVCAFRGFGDFRGQTEKEFYGWLMAIMANRLSDRVRHFRKTQRRNIDCELPPAAVEAAFSRLRDEAATPGTRFIANDEQRRVRLALERLKEPHRSVLIERTWHGASFSEIGMRIGCSAEAARKTWTRAVYAMEKILAEIE